MSSSTMSPAAEILVSLIPIVGIFFGAVVVFFALLWRHREIKQKIAQGNYSPTKYNFKALVLLVGIFLTIVGSILTLMFIILHGLSWAALGGLMPLSTGISLLIFYKLNPNFEYGKDNSQENSIDEKK